MDNYKIHIGHQTFNLKESDAENLDIVKRNGVYHTLVDGQNYETELLSIDDKTLTLKVNNSTYTIQIADQVDQTVEKMGLDKPAEIIMTNVKAPMPGLILDIMVESGQAISAGEPLLILEAMKMENVIKAVGDGIVKAVLLKKGATVEKNEVIIEME